jgi:periplasmic protein TonB
MGHAESQPRARRSGVGCLHFLTMSPILLLAAILAAQGGGSRAAMSAAPPPAATPQLPPAPPTDWPPLSLFSPDDYPAAAMRGDEEGTTRYRIEIGRDGRVARCAITGSSGSSALDSATCRIVTRRTRFTPARDSRGRPVPDVRDGEITWRMDD